MNDVTKAQIEAAQAGLKAEVIATIQARADEILRKEEWAVIDGCRQALNLSTKQQPTAP